MGKRIEDLSDDEIASMTPEQFAAYESGNDDEPAPTPDVSTPEPEPEELTPTEELNPTPVEEDDDKPAPATKEKPAPDSDSTDKGSKTEVAEVDKDKQTEDKTKTEAPVVNFEEEYKKLLAPIKANGRDLQVNSIEEARTLMSMGAGFNKKMQALKPHLATVRMLENAGINQEQLNFLIDVHKKDPAAINKLVKESGIDPIDLSPEKADNYRPGNHRPADNEIVLDEVINDIRDTPSYARTLDIVANKMDPQSKSIVASNPQVIKAINDHVQSGIYDLVMAEVDRQRMFNGLSGLSDLEAYRQVGDAMHASGKFAHLENPAGQPGNQGQQANPAQVVATSNPKKADDSKREAQKRAVAPVKGTVSGGKAVSPDFNPLSMSDEDFAKLARNF